MSIAEINDTPASAAEFDALLDKADLNALRLALLQLTGNPALGEMKTFKQPVWGGVFSVPMVKPEHHEAIRKLAKQVLRNPPGRLPADPPLDKAKQLMEIFSGEKLNDNAARLGYEELAFDPFPRGVEWKNRPSKAQLATYHVTIIGCGLSGIAIAVLLEKLGIPYTVIEREAAIGGTWWVNKFPECRVDVAAHSYQYKFEKNYPWSEHFPSAQETLKYLNHIVDKYGIRPNLRLNTRLLGGRWDEKNGMWDVRIAGPDDNEEILRSNFVFNATGQFSRPKLPDIEGIKGFEGKIFHPARWDTGYSFKGKRVALIGSGATGSQLMPAVAREAKSLTVYQRTPQWVIAFDNYKAKMTAEDRYLFDKIPYYWNWYCYSAFVRMYELQYLTIIDKDWMAKGGLISKANDKLREVMTAYIKEKTAGDEEMFQKLLPPFAPLARRVIVDNGWYDAFMRDNVELVTDGIARFTPKGIVSTDGIEREFDLVISATGYSISDYFGETTYVGRDGKTPSDIWAKDGPRAYLSLMIPSFPNFYMFYGPNAQPRVGGLYTWAECWARFCVSTVKHVIENKLHSVAISEQAYRAYNDRLDEAAKINLRGPEFSKGSWYVNEFGRPGANMPFDGDIWHAMMYQPRFDEFDVR